MDAFCHFWRVIGFMLGIKDEYNLCTDSFETTLPRAEQIRDKVYAKALLQPCKSFPKMSFAVIDGLWCFNPFLNYDAIMYFTSMLSNVPNYTYSLVSIGDVPQPLKKLDIYSRIGLWLLVFTHTITLQWTFSRVYHNTQMLISEFLIRYFPFLAFYKFQSFKKSYVRI